MGFIPRLRFVGDLQDSRILCVFGSRTLVPISWMCKKQTSVSHSSRDSEIISLDVGLRKDGQCALHLWIVVIDVSRSSHSTKTPTNPAAGNCSRNHKSKPKQETRSRHSPAGSCSFGTEDWSARARRWRRCISWAHNLGFESDRPDGQTIHQRAESRTIVWFQSAVSTKTRQEQRTQLHQGGTWCAEGWFWRGHTESLTHLEPVLVHWMKCAKCDTQRENVRMRVYGEVLLGRKICWKKKTTWLVNMQDCEGNLRTQGNLGYSWNTVRPHQFPDASGEHDSFVDFAYHVHLAILLVATLATVSRISQWWEVHHVEFCDHGTRCRELRLPVLALPFQILLNRRS